MNEPVPARPGGSVAGFDPGAIGVTPPSKTGRHGLFLTDVIVELGFAGKESIDEAEEAARSSGKTVEQILLDSGAIDENQLSLAIAERNGLDHVDLETFEVAMDAAETISRSMATRCGAVPIARAVDGALIVAVQDPFDTLSARRIETTTESEVRVVIAATSAIKRVIERLPEEAAQSTPGEHDVPRMKSQRELLVDGEPQMDDADEQTPVDLYSPELLEREPMKEVSAQDAIARTGPDLEEVTKPHRPDPEVDHSTRAEPEPEPAPTHDPLAVFDDVLSLDFGTTSNLAEEPSPAGPSDDRKRERELIETKGKVAELERRLEEVVSAAEEATAINDKLSALRRALDESGH